MSMLAAVTSIACGKGRTKQKIGVEHDINKIIAKFKRTGTLPVLTDNLGQFVDTTTVGDYQHCQEVVRLADEKFNSYPSEFRRRFNNDAKQFLEYVENLSKNPQLIDEAVSMGIIEKPKPVNLTPKDATANKNEKGE